MKEGAFSHSASEHDLKFIDALVGWSWFGYFFGVFEYMCGFDKFIEVLWLF